MRQATFPLTDQRNMDNAIAFIQKQELTGDKEVTIRNAGVGKTLQQLGALFGLWVMEVSERDGLSEARIHREWKREFLERIYKTEAKNNHQRMWVDLCTILQETGKFELLEFHRDHISLSWADINQTKQYMNAIQNHYIDIGEPLTIPDKFRRCYR